MYHHRVTTTNSLDRKGAGAAELRSLSASPPGRWLKSWAEIVGTCVDAMISSADLAPARRLTRPVPPTIQERTMTIQAVIPLFPQFTALDGIGPYEVLQRLPEIDVTFIGHDARRGAQRQRLPRHHARRDVRGVPGPDLIVFPGGVGTRALMRDERVLEWVRNAHRTTRYTTSVCTGSLVLGAAGLLDGLTATTHWAVYEELAKTGAMPGAGAGRRAPRPADHHRRRRVERHRHGVATARGPVRPHRRRGQSADDRVRPAAAVRRRHGRQGRRQRHGRECSEYAGSRK